MHGGSGRRASGCQRAHPKLASSRNWSRGYFATLCAQVSYVVAQPSSVVDESASDGSQPLFRHTGDSPGAPAGSICVRNSYSPAIVNWEWGS